MGGFEGEPGRGQGRGRSQSLRRNAHGPPTPFLGVQHANVPQMRVWLQGVTTQKGYKVERGRGAGPPPWEDVRPLGLRCMAR